MRTRIAGGLFVSHLRSETDLKSHNQKALTCVSAFFTRCFRKFRERHLAKLKFEPHQYVSYEART